jgi:hypothetical protein
MYSRVLLPLISAGYSTGQVVIISAFWDYHRVTSQSLQQVLTPDNNKQGLTKAYY